ncbi:MAG TPA: phosphatase PAP2 family protein [Chloroflexota bacterium]|nr:phosphatase PAP2 family protein [Chloroflexota bacterium]
MRGVGLFAIGAVVLAAMSIAAHKLAYFPVDVGISRDVQAYHPGWLDTATAALSWTGFPPQSDVLFGVIVLLLFGLGQRLAAAAEVFAAVGSGGLYLVLQQVVGQPRPSADLVQVAGPIQLSGFPSGHLATFVAVFGFLAWLGYRSLQPSAMRWLPVVLVGVLLLLMGFARIYAGQHWASDVLAGCLLGGLWLAVTIRLYAWGCARRASADRAQARPVSGTQARTRSSGSDISSVWNT